MGRLKSPKDQAVARREAREQAAYVKRMMARGRQRAPVNEVPACRCGQPLYRGKCPKCDR